MAVYESVCLRKSCYEIKLSLQDRTRVPTRLPNPEPDIRVQILQIGDVVIRRVSKGSEFEKPYHYRKNSRGKESGDNASRESGHVGEARAALAHLSTSSSIRSASGMKPVMWIVRRRSPLCPVRRHICTFQEQN